MQRVLNIFFLTSLLLGANNALLERKTVLKKIQKYPYLLAYVDEKYKDDEELVLLAIKQNGGTLEYASKSLQDNEAVVREAVSSNGGALAYVSERLKDNDDIVSIAIDSYGTYLQHASPRLQNDDDIVLDALRSNGANLQYASKRLQDDKWYVSLAIKNNSSALEYASKRLQNERTLVLLSVRTYSSNLAYASSTLQDDYKIVLEAIKQDGRALRYASKRLRNNQKVIELALQSSDSNLAYASKFLQKKLAFHRNNEIQIEFNENIENLKSVPLGIKSSLLLKNIIILDGKRIIGKYNVSKGEPIDYHIALNLNHGVGEQSGEIVILLEELNGKKHRIVKNYLKANGMKRLYEKYKNKEAALNAFTEQKYKRHILKLRIKDEVAYGAFMVMHPMLGEKSAEKLTLQADYIEHIVGKNGDNIVFDFYTSSLLRADPFFRFTFNAPKKSGKLEIVVTDNRGNKRRFYKEYKI